MEITSVRHDWPEKPGFTISRPGGHSDYTLLHFMCCVTLEINGVRQELENGAFVIYSPGTPQWFTGKKGILHNWMHISGNYAEMLKRFDLQPDTVYYTGSGRSLSKMFAEIEAEYFTRNPYRNEMIETKIRELTILLSRSVRSALPEGMQNDKREIFDRVRNMMLSSPEKDWHVSELARMALVSKSGYYAAYKQYYGSTPIEDIIEARIRYAQSLLVTTTDTLSEIANTVGYTNQYHFIRQFRQLVGQTPASYRREMKL